MYQEMDAKVRIKKPAVAVEDTSTANEVLQAMNGISERAKNLVVFVNKKLAPIQKIGYPSPMNEEVKSKEYPPFFEEIRAQLMEINRSLDDIENAMYRVDL